MPAQPLESFVLRRVRWSPTQRPNAWAQLQPRHPPRAAAGMANQGLIPIPCKLHTTLQLLLPARVPVWKTPLGLLL